MWTAEKWSGINCSSRLSRLNHTDQYLDNTSSFECHLFNGHESMLLSFSLESNWNVLHLNLSKYYREILERIVYPGKVNVFCLQDSSQHIAAQLSLVLESAVLITIPVPNRMSAVNIRKVTISNKVNSCSNTLISCEIKRGKKV